MRLSDAIFRQGHLSEKALVVALTSGERPAHLDRCDLCADRATELSTWLDGVRTTGIEAVDAVFADEQLKVQRAQIMARLEHADEPSRVIAFPRHAPVQASAPAVNRVAPAWLGVAAAAGIALGVIGGQITARMTSDPAAPVPAAASAEGVVTDPQPTPVLDVDPLDPMFDEYMPESLSAIDEMMPAVLLASTTAGG